MQGWRNTMEDSHICLTNLGDNCSLFGVFDGHGGKQTFITIITPISYKRSYFIKLKSCYDYNSTYAFIKLIYILSTWIHG